MNWSALINEQTVRTLLSAGLAPFARPISEALVLFLSGLPDTAQRAILAAQAALPTSASLSERFGRLAQQCPVLHKLGQALARDRRLDPALRRELQKLEALPPTVPLETIRATLEQELGSMRRLGVRLDSRAIAEASVAVVIGYRDERRSGVFKLLKPGVEERLVLELELLEAIGVHLDERCQQLAIPKIGYEESFRQIKEKLQNEVRLDVERQHLAQARRLYADLDQVQVPELHDYCTLRVTAMERMNGRKVTDHGLSSQAARRELASLVASALLAQPLFSTSEQALFHGDPHAGNLLLTPAGRLVLLDWSLAGTLGPTDREAIVHVLLEAMLDDEGRVVDMLAALSDAPLPDTIALRALVRRRLSALGPGRLPDFGWLVGLMDDAVELGGLKARSDLLVFRKALHTLNELVAELSMSDRLIDQALFAAFLQSLVAEWPQRWLAAPASRAFATRLSNVDLSRLMLHYPLAVTRFWMGLTTGRSADGPTRDV